MRADERRSCISGQAEDQTAVGESRVPARLAWLNGDAIEEDFRTEFCEQRLEVIPVAHRSAADGYQHVCTGVE